VNVFSRLLPWGVCAVAALYLGVMMLPSRQDAGGLDRAAFARLPAVDGGRVKPLDSVARTNLMILSGRQTFVDDRDKENPVRRSAVEWLLDVLASPLGEGGPAEKHKVFRIENEQVLSLLGLQPRPGFRYAIEEFSDKLEQFYAQANRAKKVPKEQRDLFDVKLIETAQHFELYTSLATRAVPYVLPPRSPGEEWQPYAQAEKEAQLQAMTFLKAELARRGKDLKDLKGLGDEEKRALFQQARQKFDEALPAVSPAAQAYRELLRAYEDGKPRPFNRSVAEFAKFSDREPSGEVARARFEVFFNSFAPFYQCIVLYVWVFVLACAGWVTLREPLHRAAFWLAVLTLAVHTWALCARMYLQGRPPVTNLYSSAVFIGWGCVILCLILERIYRLGLGSAVAGVLGATTLVIAHYLSVSGDTLEMMQAVLDTNFWLATHVTCITLGYTATFVAGFLGLTLIGTGVLTPSLTPDLFRKLGRMIYGVTCFAMLCSFTGTVLGGIWADQSWGRFWGWDPKENGALLIVLANALLLHARWGGMVKERGIATLAVFGNIVTAWSWFGVNMLGVGLHSYGFMEKAVPLLVGFVLFNLFAICAGLLPLRMWSRFAPPPQPLPAPAADGPEEKPASAGPAWSVQAAEAKTAVARR
jgi:ABC-type transport system involved in cytochrome c biogenesis permease subunit